MRLCTELIPLAWNAPANVEVETRNTGQLRLDRRQRGARAEQRRKESDYRIEQGNRIIRTARYKRADISDRMRKRSARFCCLRVLLRLGIIHRLEPLPMGITDHDLKERSS